MLPLIPFLYVMGGVVYLLYNLNNILLNFNIFQDYRTSPPLYSGGILHSSSCIPLSLRGRMKERGNLIRKRGFVPLKRPERTQGFPLLPAGKRRGKLRAKQGMSRGGPGWEVKEPGSGGVEGIKSLRAFYK